MYVQIRLFSLYSYSSWTAFAPITSMDTRGNALRGHIWFYDITLGFATHWISSKADLISTADYLMMLPQAIQTSKRLVVIIFSLLCKLAFQTKLNINRLTKVYSIYRNIFTTKFIGFLYSLRNIIYNVTIRSSDKIYKLKSCKITFLFIIRAGLPWIMDIHGDLYGNLSRFWPYPWISCINHLDSLYVSF